MNTTTKATKHATDCDASFGRRTAGCPRCEELKNGAAPRARFGSPVRAAAHEMKLRDEAATLKAIRSHRCDASCGVVCTAFQW